MAENVEQARRRITHAAFEYLRETRIEPVNYRELGLDDDLIKSFMTTWQEVLARIRIAYDGSLDLTEEATMAGLIARAMYLPVDMAEDDISMDEAEDDIGTDEAEGRDVGRVIERDRFEIARAYLGGDTVLPQLQQYITKYALDVAKYPRLLKFPYISIVQSAGFGKSRLLCELARSTKVHPGGPTRVLYISMGSSDIGASPYPRETQHLRDYFFPSGRAEVNYDRRQLIDKLIRLYDFAVTHWDTVGDEWFSLFQNQEDADFELCRRLNSHDRSASRHTVQQRILVLAIDKARELLEGSSDKTWFIRLRNELRQANYQIRKQYGERASIFGILVDTNSKIANFVPPVVQDASTRMPMTSNSKLYPPFVLTHTMDVRLDSFVAAERREGETSAQFFQRLVMVDDSTAWRSLVSMGRPLWDRANETNLCEKESSSDTIQLAANMLLGGLKSKRREDYKEESLFGVASVLCRIGVRPSTWSPLASRTVANLAAILHHTNISHERYITSYASEPILTFGAARVWYDSASSDDAHSLLNEHILPQLRKLLCQDVVDTGGVGELVSRIVLLLAIDATGTVLHRSTSDRDPRQYDGRFYSVETFIRVLHGDAAFADALGVQFKRNDPQRIRINAWINRWEGWSIGFSHFVQLSDEPDEDMLWAMLARRAAGIFPRNFKGVDLFIPIFQGTDVSVALVQVKNHANRGQAYPGLATTAMWPSQVFTDELQHKRPEEVVCIYMSLRGPRPEAREQYFLEDPDFGANSPPSMEYDIQLL